ncbi:MAG: hypothetical protein FWG66_15970 [Spirochaetes bacterium]|nr:hypothetical protein [Spirochaetota bacterium]
MSLRLKKMQKKIFFYFFLQKLLTKLLKFAMLFKQPLDNFEKDGVLLLDGVKTVGRVGVLKVGRVKITAVN